MDYLETYRVHMRSKPGMMAQYKGYVDVFASNDQSAIRQANIELKRGSFPDRGPGCWIVEKVERLVNDNCFTRGLF